MRLQLVCPPRAFEVSASSARPLLEESPAPAEFVPELSFEGATQKMLCSHSSKFRMLEADLIDLPGNTGH